MTISNSNNRTRLSVVATTYDYTFRIDDSSELLVYTIDEDGVATLKTLTTHYTVSISDVTEGGTVTFLVTPDAEEVLMIRNKLYKQTADIPVRGGFNESVIEGALDNVVMQVQQLKELLDFCVKQESTAVPVTVTIPAPEDGMALVWDGVDGAMMNAPVDAGAVAEALDDAEAAAAAAAASQAAAAASQSAAAVSAAAAAAALAAFLPVGIVVTLGVSTNPATLFGLGTWTAIAGKVIVGINGADTEFDTLDETGGAKTVTLDTTMIPAHTHTFQPMDQTDFTGGGQVPGVSSTTPDGAAVTTSSTGGGAAHNNLQPYIVKYVWQRTA